MKPTQIVLLASIALIISFSIFGCKEDEETSLSTTALDTTAPTVISISPVDSSTDIAIDTSILITFSEAMDDTSITANTTDTVCSGSFQLSSNDFVECIQVSEPTTDTEKKVFTVQPSSNLTLNTTYKIKLTTGVSDIAGNALAEDYVQGTGYTTVTEATTDTTSDTSSDSFFSISSISGNTGEDLTQATFTVKLKIQPTDDVTIGVSSSDETEGTVSPTSLTFTSGDWNTDQIVTVTGVDDIIRDFNKSFSTILSIVASLDMNYNGINPPDVTVVNDDDDFKLPDTNQTTCFSDNSIITCPTESENYFGQDANFIINSPSYTNNGDNTVTDNKTGLTWQQATANGTFSSNPATAYCSDLQLAGYSDWRLPNINELISIIDYGVTQPSINQTFFPDTEYTYTCYASSNVNISNGEAKRVCFGVGIIDSASINHNEYVRCVRGGTESFLWPYFFTDGGNGTVLHNSTGLTWQQEDDDIERKWSDAVNYCDGLSLGSYSDWRLPNIKELHTIIYYSDPDRTIFDSVFPNTNGCYYWSSTNRNYDQPFYAFRILFSASPGEVDNGNKTSVTYHYARCVRGGN